MHFGIFDWIDRNPATLQQTYEDRLRLLEAADEAGFFCYHLAEHHATPLGMAPSPGIFLAAAAQRTHRIRLGPTRNLFTSPKWTFLLTGFTSYLPPSRSEDCSTEGSFLALP